MFIRVLIRFVLAAVIFLDFLYFCDSIVTCSFNAPNCIPKACWFTNQLGYVLHASHTPIFDYVILGNKKYS